MPRTLAHLITRALGKPERPISPQPRATMMRRIASLVAVLLLAAAPAAAQDGSITGVVTDATTGEAIPGVNVVIDALNLGTASNQDGVFRIDRVPAGTHAIRASYIGYIQFQARLTVAAGEEAQLNIELRPDVVGLSELVVTALGVEREERSLGYSSQMVNTEGMTESRTTNFVDALSGKIAGAQITNANSSVGGSSRIVLRGVNSLTGSNQPLFIVDGVYIDNTTFQAAGEFGGIDFGNAAMDINPDDIASITVLKGPNAAALYGSRAANGAIVIRTKDGRGVRSGQVDVTFSSTLTSDNILLLPDMQNEYGQGLYGHFSFVDGLGGGVFDGGDESWGPPLDGRLIAQFDSPIVNGVRQATPWVPQPNNVRDYFENGLSWTNNISLAGSYQQTNFRLSYTNLNQDGIFPAESLDRHTLQLAAGSQLSERFRADARATFTALNAQNRPSVGYTDDNPMQQLTQWFGRQINMESLRDYMNEDGTPFNWNYQYMDNPFWTQYENGNSQDRNRLTGNVTLSYDLLDWVNVTGLVGLDRYNDRRENWTAIYTLNDPDGAFSNTAYEVSEVTSNIRVNAQRDLSEDFYLDVLAGGEITNRRYNMQRNATAGLSVPFIYSINNASIAPTADDWREERQRNSLFAAATVGFRDYLYLDLTARNDWSSTLPVDNNSYFYPSASLSFIFSDAFEIGGDWLSFGKLRGSWTRVGNDTDPYRLRATFEAPGTGRFGDIPYFTVGNTLPNENLKPERTESWEFGTELRFLNGRLGLDATYYARRTFDQILPVQNSRATGYVSRIVNAGEMRNSGIELSLMATPVQTSDFMWDAQINWAKNTNEVVSLAEGLDTYVIGSTWDATVEARPGEPFGTLRGRGFLRDDSGNIVVNAAGIPMLDQEIKSWGSYQPDWTAGISNTFTYRGVSLSSLIDIKMGGKLSSVTYMFGRYTGILEETLEGRAEYAQNEDGVWQRVSGGFVFDGGDWADGAVKQDGSPNDITVGAQEFNSMFYGNLESHLFDATYVKLRELRLGYRLPASWLQTTPMRSVDLGLVGRNLLILHKDAPHIDPETAFNAGNLQGLESNQFPAVRSFGFNVRVGF